MSGYAERFPSLLPIAAFAAAKAVPGLITLVSIPVWLWAFGARNYALYSLYWAASVIGTSLTIGWLIQAILRHSGDASRQWERVPPSLRFAAQAAPALVTIPIGFITAGSLPDPSDRWRFLVIAAIGLLANSHYVVRQTLVQRDGRAATYAVAGTVRTGSALALSGVLLLLDVIEPWSLLAAGVAGTVVAICVVHSRRDPRVARVDRGMGAGIVRAYWDFGWPLSLWLTMSAGAMYLDRFVINALYGAERAGAYAAAADLVVRGMGILVAPVVLYWHPVFMRSWNTDGRAAALRVWRRSTAVLTGVALVVALLAFCGYLAFADVLLNEPISSLTFASLLVGSVAWQVALLAHKPLEARDRTGLMLAALAVSLLTTVGLDVVLAPSMAEAGVALSFAAGALLYVGLVTRLNRRVLIEDAEEEVHS